MARVIAAACLLLLPACGSAGGEGEFSVELQVINGQGISQDSHLTIRVTTPRSTERKPFPFGDSSKPENWARFHASLNTGELVQFALETATGAQVVADTCTFDEPASGNYARVVLTPLDLGAGRHLDCGEGFESDEP